MTGNGRSVVRGCANLGVWALVYVQFAYACDVGVGSFFQHGLLSDGSGFLLSLSLSHVNKISFRIARVKLSRAADFVTAANHLAPVRDPAGCATRCKDDGEHFNRNANGFQDNAGIEVHVWIQLFLNKVLVFQRNALEF